MAPPTTVTRPTPTGWKLPDGFRTKVGIGANPGIQFWEKSVKPMGVDGGEPIDITTMYNTRWHTLYPKTLIKGTEMTGKAAYDPNVYPELQAIVNMPCSMTVLFPTNATLTFYGALSKFEFGELREGEFPEADYTIVVTNYDPINGVEQGPVYTPAPGTP